MIVPVKPCGGDASGLSRPLLPDTASIDGRGRLSIGHVDILDLVAEVGTPAYIYDETHLRNRCRTARQVFGDGVSYASKAFLCRAMARLAHEEGMSIDVATGGELHVAVQAGVPAERLVLHGSNKSEAELAAAVASGVGRIVVDSLDEIDRLTRLLPRRGSRPSALVRINPAIEPHTHEYLSTGQGNSRFGFAMGDDASAAVERLRRPDLPVDLVGLHVHIGSQLFDLEPIKKAIEAVADFFVPLGLPELCIGGGLGVAYVDGNAPPSIGDWGAAVRAAAAASGISPAVRLTAEPGRAVAAQAAITCYEVGTIKEVPGAPTFVSVDGGMSDNLRPALYRSRYEAFLPRATEAIRPRPVTIVGKHCESGDVLVEDGRLPTDVTVGDIVATPVTGAYGYSMASNYNRQPRPPVVFVRDGGYRVVVRRETLDDLLRQDDG